MSSVKSCQSWHERVQLGLSISQLASKNQISARTSIAEKSITRVTKGVCLAPNIARRCVRSAPENLRPGRGPGDEHPPIISAASLGSPRGTGGSNPPLSADESRSIVCRFHWWCPLVCDGLRIRQRSIRHPPSSMELRFIPLRPSSQRLSLPPRKNLKSCSSSNHLTTNTVAFSANESLSPGRILTDVRRGRAHHRYCLSLM